MDKSQILLSFLQKNCGITEPIPESDKERFEYYKGAINLLPQKYINESFLKVEDGYLADLLHKKEITSVSASDTPLTVVMKEAACFSADAVLSFLSEGADKSIYLYGGTRLKSTVLAAISGKDIAVTKANNVFYKGVISAVLPKIDSKLTSVVLGNITEKYRFALDLARDNKLNSLVLCVPTVDNLTINNRIAIAIVNEIKSHPYYNSLKIVLVVSGTISYSIYKKAVGDKV